MATTIFRADSPHTIAMLILTNRMFKQYRAKVFKGEGGFTSDYSFLIKRIGMLFNSSTGRLGTSSIAMQLQAFSTPTLVQINHVASTVTEVKTPDSTTPLNEWAILYNQSAPETTSYRVAGLSLSPQKVA